MTMIVTVVRPAHDATNGGISGKHDRLLVIGNDAEAPDSPAFPVMVLAKLGPGAVCLRPLVVPEDRQGHVGPMFGGNYAVGDRLFNDAVETLLGTKFYGAVAIHDRFESQELFDQTSR